MPAEQIVQECRERLAAYQGETVRKSDVNEWLALIERELERDRRRAGAPEYGVDYGAWGT